MIRFSLIASLLGVTVVDNTYKPVNDLNCSAGLQSLLVTHMKNNFDLNWQYNNPDHTETVEFHIYYFNGYNEFI